MKQTIYLLLILSIASLLVGCSPSTPAATQPGGDVEVIAQTVVEQLGKGEYAAVFNQFDSNMKSAFSEAQLKSTWEQIVAQAGSLQKSMGVKISEQQGYQIAIVTCQFEIDLLDIQLGFNDQGQIIGLSFARAQAAVPTQPAYTAPDYVKTGSFSEFEVTSR